MRLQKGDQTDRDSPRWLQIHRGPAVGVHVYVSQRCQAVINGDFDEFLYSALGEKKFPFVGATIWDVGAHIGYHSLAFARLVGPSGRVVAFEPNRFNQERFHMHLHKNSDLATRVSLMTCALSDCDGEQPFRFSRDIDRGRSAGSFLDRGILPGDRTPEAVYAEFKSELVSVRKADNLLTKEELPPPALMKIDVEGAEYGVLLGASTLLQQHRPVLLMEIHNITCMFQVQKLLQELGYRLHLLDDGRGSASRCFILADCVSSRMTA